MQIRAILDHIVVSGVFHVHQMMLLDTGAVAMSTELIRFLEAQGYELLEQEIPGVEYKDAEEWARNYAYSLLVHKAIIPQDASPAVVLTHFKNTLPQVYQDLVTNGEVLEARMREDVLH
jgi:hypothetical protein